MRRIAIAGLLLSAALTAPAQVVIYRCTDASGALTVQNDQPCPKGSRQVRSVIDPPPPLPAYTPQAPAVATPATPARTTTPRSATQADAPARPRVPLPAALADAERLPPPPIFQCNTWDNDSYISEDPEPKPRCVPLQTTGLGGNPDKGAGAACEMKYDQCQRVADRAACDGWARRQREIESAWRFSRGDARSALQEEFTRVARILSDTTCSSRAP
jgi:hypothetical protein